MRISDWSSDVCSSDLVDRSLLLNIPQLDVVLQTQQHVAAADRPGMLRAQLGVFARHPLQQRAQRDGIARLAPVERIDDAALGTEVEAQQEVTREVESADQIGRASCRERGGQYD